MEYIKNNLSDRFFYVRERTPADDGITAAAYDRMFPMSRLQAMCMVSADSLEVSFDDAGVGDHTTVKLLITSGKGREAIKDIVDAINSTQKIVTLGNELTKESVINDFISVDQIAEGAVGTFALNGALTVAGAATFNGGIAGKRRVQHLDGTTAEPQVSQSGTILVFDGTACTVTLPTCEIGLEYTFLVRESHSAADAIITTQSADKLFGSLIRAVDGLNATFDADNTQVDTTTGTNDNTITMNGTTQGGIVGSRIQITGITGNKWQVHGELIGSGTQITVFS